MSRVTHASHVTCSKLSSTNPVGSFWITIEGNVCGLWFVVCGLRFVVWDLLYQPFTGHQFEIPKSAWWLDQTQEACIESSPAGMNGLLIGDVFFREYLVQFDVSAPDKTVIGIGKLRHDYHPVKELEQRRVVNVDASSQSLAQTLHVMPAFKKSGRTLTQRPVTRLAALQSPVTGLSSDVLLDDMPVFNRHGTQYVCGECWLQWQIVTLCAGTLSKSALASRYSTSRLYSTRAAPCLASSSAAQTCPRTSPSRACGT